MTELLSKPWPWYIGGALIGLIVPALLLLGNKHFGISANLRHACAACFPSNLKFFQYEWKKELWNLFFVAGLVAGAVIASTFLINPAPIGINGNLVRELQEYGIRDYRHLLPSELFSLSALFSWRGLIMLVGGGFLVGFGTRYAGGCTSGHAIMRLSDLQLTAR